LRAPGMKYYYTLCFKNKTGFIFSAKKHTALLLFNLAWDKLLIGCSRLQLLQKVIKTRINARRLCAANNYTHSKMRQLIVLGTRRGRN